MIQGDLVRLIDLGDNPVPGSLTAIKFFQRLYNDFGGKTGIVTKVSGNNAYVMFENKQKVIHIDMLEIIT